MAKIRGVASQPKREEVQSIREYLLELKRLALISVVAIAIGSAIGFAYHTQIIEAIRKPLGQTLYYTTPAGGLAFVMQISLYAGLILSLPIVLYQVIMFLRPAIKPIRLRATLTIFIASILLSICAAIYAYKLSLPAALDFLTHFNSEGVKSLISVGDYTKFFFAYLFGSMLTFQLPLIIIVTNQVRRFPPGALAKSQRPMILAAVIVSGVITPTVDPVNQLLIALPIIFLYEVGVFVVWRTNRAFYANQVKKSS